MWLIPFVRGLSPPFLFSILAEALRTLRFRVVPDVLRTANVDEDSVALLSSLFACLSWDA
jgi:hypothetical protein